MICILQRVSQASVTVAANDGERQIASISRGYLLLVGVFSDDQPEDTAKLADKVAHLRLFDDGSGRPGLSLVDVHGEALIVSNFTLCADTRKGRRPSWSRAASAPLASRLYERFGDQLTGHGIPVSYGEFGADMSVSLVNDGPVTLILDSREA